jgi:hypothetical protein
MINKELNIVKLMKNMRDMKILMKSKLLDQETKFEIAHSTKNIINIDNTTTDEDASDLEDKRLQKKMADKESSLHLKKDVTESLKNQLADQIKRATPPPTTSQNNSRSRSVP